MKLLLMMVSGVRQSGDGLNVKVKDQAGHRVTRQQDSSPAPSPHSDIREKAPAQASLASTL